MRALLALACASLAACATTRAGDDGLTTRVDALAGTRAALAGEAKRTPAEDAWLARTSEALGADFDALGHWLSAAERAPGFRRWAEVRLVALLDRLERGPIPPAWLERSRRLPELAEFSERLAIALGDRAALDEARVQLGTTFWWRRSSRLLRYPGNTSSLPLRGDGLLPGGVNGAAGFIASPEDGPGLYAFELALPAGRWQVEVLTECAVEAFVGDAVVASHPALQELRAERLAFAVDLSGAPLELHLVSRAAVARARVFVRPARSSIDPPRGTLGALARLEIALAARDVAAAHDHLADLPPDGPLTRLGLARLAILDPTRAPERARTAAKSVLAAVIEREPDFAEARALLVALYADDQELDDARRVLGPDSPHQLVVLAAVVDPARAATAAAAALHLAPHSCRHRNAWLDTSWERLRYHADEVAAVFATDLAPLPGPCLDAHLRAIELLREGAELAAADRLLQPVLLGLDPGPDQARAFTLAAQLALARGAWDKAASHAAGALALGGADAFARELLNRALRLEGAPPIPRLDPRADLGLPLTAARPLILAALQKAGRRLGADGRETLLDDRHVRVNADGSLRIRVHRIVRVNDVAAVESVGELPVPDDAEILFVRTWKHDKGVLRPLEPEDILEKATVSLPNLAPGDFAEWAWFYPLAQEPRLMPGWRAPTYAFDSDDGPVAHARYTVSTAPGARPPVFTFDPRVAPPARPDATTWVFEAKNLPRVFTEPLDPRPEVHRMALTASSVIEWLPLGDALTAEIAYATRPSPTLAAMLADALRGVPTGDQSALLGAIYRHVLAHIEEPADATPFGVEASWIAERGRGSRALLVTALCREAGLHCELVLARPLWEGPEPAHADLEGLTYPLVRWAPPGRKPIWLDPTSRWMPLGLLPPALEGRFGVALGKQSSRVETAMPHRDDPAQDPVHWGERKVDIQLVVERGGVGVIANGTETLDGVFGSSWRTALTGMGADERREVLGAIVQQALPAATIESVAIERLEDLDEPLVITWRARTATTAVDSKTERGSRALSIALFPEGLTNDTVVLPTRTTPLLVNRAARMSLTISALAPDGHVFSLAPSDQDLTYDLGSFKRLSRFEELGRKVVVDKRFLLRPGVIEPSRYAAWSEAAVAIDRFDLVQLILTPNRSPRTPL